MSSQQEKLRQHFAGRVTTQARVVLEAWQQAVAEPRSITTSRLQELQYAVDKLARYAARFAMQDHLSLAEQIGGLLKVALSSAEALSEAETRHLDEPFKRLAQLIGRKTDRRAESRRRHYLRAPIYIALDQTESRERICRQLQFFGFRGEGFGDIRSLQHAVQARRPDVLLIDTDFGGRRNQGIALVKVLQNRLETPLPVLFVCDREGDIETRLEASRSGGEEFIEGSSSTSRIIEKIETYTRGNTEEPYRILVIDDSRAQAAFMDSTLRKAGMQVLSITDPMTALEAFQQFEPEIIIMDMYMPGCTGTELARVLRQDEKFMGVPIIYLSAEDDINKQLHAMSLGGDDFLVKPINPRHLIATIHNRGRRSRSLNALMVRDSLTGLYNHTHIFNLLSMGMAAAEKRQQELCLAMLDIDHFKRINDTHGHPMGDRVLKSLSLFLKQRLRKSDHIGRYGGEEFLIVLPDTTASDGQRILDELRARFSELAHPTDHSEIQVTFSCGVASMLPSGDTAKGLSRRADEALYQAKGAGRNCVKLWTAVDKA